MASGATPEVGARRRPAWSRLALLGIVGLASIESIAAALAARDPGIVAWPKIAAAIEARDDADPVFVAQDWLGPVARMHVPEIAYLPSVARPDLHAVGRFHVIGWADDGDAMIARDLEGLPAPTLEATKTFGPLVWTTYAAPAAGTLVEDLTAESSTMHVITDAGNCRGRGSFRCNEGTVEPRIAEIDYRPRKCLGLEVQDGTTVRLVWPSARLGDTLRGHVGLSDYNARLRNDAPVRVVVRVGGTEMLRATVTDLQGWWPLVVPTTPGVASVEIEVTAGLSGTFGAQQYDPAPTRITCLEIRTIGGAP